MPVAYCRAYRLLPPGEGGILPSGILPSGILPMPEGRMRATPILLQHLIREKLVPLAILGGLKFCRLEAGGPTSRRGYLFASEPKGRGGLAGSPSGSCFCCFLTHNPAHVII
jgi:hypothetical protein